MGSKSIKTNYIYNLLYQIFTILTPLITTPYVSRVIQADGIGVYSFANSIVSYFLLFAAMGTTTYGKREVSYVQNDVEARSHVFWNVVAFRAILSVTAAAAYIVFVLIGGFDKHIYLIFLLNIVTVIFDISWFFHGMEEFRKITIRDTIFKLIGIVCIFLFVKKKDDLPLYIFLMSGISLFSALSFWSIIPKYITKIQFSKLSPFKNWRVIISLFIPTIAMQVYHVLDKTMIGAITGSSFENGYYEQALKISHMVLAIVTALGTVMIPRIGSLFAQHKNDEVRDYMYRGYRFVWFIGIPICFGLIGIAENLVPWFFGAGYEPVIGLIKILAFLVLAIGINNVTGMQYLIPTGKENLFTISVFVGAGSNFILNAIMIPHWGAVGAAIASVIAESLIAVIQIIMVRRELSGKNILGMSWKYILSGLVMLVLLSFENSIFESTVLHTFIMIVNGAIIYLLMLFVLGDDFLMTNVKQILHMGNKG